MRCRIVLSFVAAVVALLSIPAAAIAQVTTRNITLRANRNDYESPGHWGYSACWGYVHPDGREYAILGTLNGTAIYNVTNPDSSRLVTFIPGLTSNWREMKAYRYWLYVVTENATPSGGIQPGIQIISMENPETPVLVATYATNFSRSHTISVDTTRAILICNGTNYRDPVTGASSLRGMRILSLANPTAPVEIAHWPADALQSNGSYYVHDCVPVGNRLYASSIYAGIQRIFDFTNPANPVEIKNWTYPAAYYTHSCWPDQARDRLYVCDEQNGQTLRVFDISNETAPSLVDEWTDNPSAIIHNPRVRGTTLWLANYTEGIRALDITDPTHPVEWGFADSYPGPSGGYNGVWDVYPYFPSGAVIASDMNTGLYVYTPSGSYGIVHAHVTDGAQPLAGARVYIAILGDSAQTGADGVVGFAPNPGTYTLVARKFGYEDASTTVTLNAGDNKTVNLALTVKPTTTLTGTVVSASGDVPLEGAEVNLRWTPVHDHTDSAGSFDLGSVPVGTYRVDVERPGYVPRSFLESLGPAEPPQTFRVSAASYYDPLTTDQGWTVGTPSDNATSGVWTRVEPLGTSIGGTQPADVRLPGGSAASVSSIAVGSRVSAADRLSVSGYPRPRPGPLHGGEEGEGATPGQVQPEYDRSPSPDSLCWVTGQGTNPTAIDEQDVDGPAGTPGTTTLTSPAYNTTSLNVPTIAYWAWFYSQFSSPDDWLAVLISNDNGASWVPVDTLRGLHNHWEQEVISVASHVTPTTQVRLRFIATDGGAPSVVEAAIDDISIYDDSAEVVGAQPADLPARLAIRAPWPNPTRGDVSLALDAPRAGWAEVDVVDLAGRSVATLQRGPIAAGSHALRWDGGDERGRPTRPGLYFVRARLGAQTAVTRLVRIP